jgi:hypothetical protein
MTMIDYTKPKSLPRDRDGLVDLERLPKRRRDFLECFGLTFSMRGREPRQPMTDEDRRAVADAINPFVARNKIA